jgi:hypothetical protein
MNNYSVIEDFPETYIYNNFNFNEKEESKRVEIDIDQVVYELLQCDKDKQKFDFIMEALEKEFIGEEKTLQKSEKEKRDKMYPQNPKPEEVHYTRQTSTISNYSEFSQTGGLNSHMTYRSNFQNHGMGAGNKVLNEPQNYNFEKNYMDMSSLNTINENSNRNNQNEFKGQGQGGHYHKKYTDVHANTKYYYPSEYQNSYEETDLNVEPSQWADRANRRTMYTNKNGGGFFNERSGYSPNKSFPSMDRGLGADNNFNNYNFGSLHSNNSTLGNNFYPLNINYGKFNKDNTNTAILNKQLQKFGNGTNPGNSYPSQAYY